MIRRSVSAKERDRLSVRQRLTRRKLSNFWILRSISPSRRRWILLVGLICALLLLVKVLLIARAIQPLFQDFETLQPFLTIQPAELNQPANLVKMEASVSRTEADLRTFREEAAILFDLCPMLGWVPHYGGDIEQAPALADFAIQGLATGRIALSMLRSVITQIPASGASASALPRGQLILKVIVSIQPEEDALKAQLRNTALARQKIDIRKLTPSLGGLVLKGDKVFSLAGSGLQLLDVLPDLSGVNHPRQYLLVAQNNDELRATGGYISGVGMVGLEDGRIVRTSYQDSYAVEDYTKPHPWPPAPLTQYMGAQMWVLRDANWSPDFPTSARVVEQLYSLNQGIQVDGVIAVNLAAVQRLVAALEPLELPTYGETIDAQNVMARMQFYFLSPTGEGQTGDWWQHRKDFMGTLMKAMIARLNGEGADVDLPRVGQALWESLAAKDILIYLNEPRASHVMNGLGWDGGLSEQVPDQNFVLAVDSNVGFNKADPKVEREFEYRVDLQPDASSSASLTIRYRNTNPVSNQACVREFKYQATYDEMQDTCYWDYVRVYAPPGTVPVGATRNISATLEAPELGYTVMSGYFVLPRGETRDIRFDYQLPVGTIRVDAPSEFHLTWIKQPGSSPTRVHVTVRFPSSLQVLNASPLPTGRSASSLEFLLPTDRDTTLSVYFEPASSFLWSIGMGLTVSVICLALVLLGRRYILRRQT